MAGGAAVTPYFERKVLIQRPYVTIERCQAVIAEPLRRDQQPDERWRYWGRISLPGTLGERILRVVTLPDGTLHNAFLESRLPGDQVMKLSYFADTDTLYIELSAGESQDSAEVSDGVVADFGGDGNLVGIEIEHASTRVDVQRLETSGLPIAQLLAA